MYGVFNLVEKQRPRFFLSSGGAIPRVINHGAMEEIAHIVLVILRVNAAPARELSSFVVKLISTRHERISRRCRFFILLWKNTLFQEPSREKRLCFFIFVWCTPSSSTYASHYTPMLIATIAGCCVTVITVLRATMFLLAVLYRGTRSFVVS